MKDLNIKPWTEFLGNEVLTVSQIVEKYKQHPSVLKIRENMPKNKVFSFQETSIEDVVKKLSDLDVSKASPVESLPPKVLKENCNIFAPKIMFDFNLSINSGNFPNSLKLADVTPVFKKDDKHDKKKFRPVSILPALSKIYERIMNGQIKAYFEDILSIFLGAFTKNMNSQNCLLFMVEKWRKSLDKNGACGILLTDLSKAFDCLNHQLLLAKLHAYGFDHLSLKVIQSYLSDRFQRVTVNASFSGWKKILTGVPQGSILGPELYNIYSNDLFYFLVLDIVNYADDNSHFRVPSISHKFSII